MLVCLKNEGCVQIAEIPYKTRALCLMKERPVLSLGDCFLNELGNADNRQHVKYGCASKYECSICTCPGRWE